MRINCATNTVIDLTSHYRNGLLLALVAMASLFISACTTAPLEPYTEASPPLILGPATQAGVVDKRIDISCCIQWVAWYLKSSFTNPYTDTSVTIDVFLLID